MTTADLVIGANYGDEGKGTITARLALQHRHQKVINVLSNGGSQRGHSVTLINKRHTFKHFGSGTPFGVVSYFPKEFIINPLQFCKEWKKLVNELHFQIPRCVRHWRCRWSTPYDMMWNQISCQLQWKGTCGMGIWSTICRYYEMPSIPSFDAFSSVYNIEQQIKFLKDVRFYYETKGLDIPFDYLDAWKSDTLIDNFIKDCQLMFEKTLSVDDIDFTQFDHAIFENGQGMLLTDNFTDDPERTPSCTDSRILWNFKNQFKDVTVHYVTRPYITRHGSDIFQEEKVDADIDKSIEINQYNQWQHKFKYAPLDINILQENILNDACRTSPKYNMHYAIDVTHCDELDRSSEFKKVFDNRLIGYPGDLTLNFYGSPIIDSE